MKRCRVKRPNFQIKNKMNKENKTSDKHEHGNDFIADVMQRFLIYADDYITWNKQKNDWNHSDEFTGTYLDAHEYARSKYGKRYTLNVAQLSYIYTKIITKCYNSLKFSSLKSHQNRSKH